MQLVRLAVLCVAVSGMIASVILDDEDFGRYFSQAQALVEWHLFGATGELEGGDGDGGKCPMSNKNTPTDPNVIDMDGIWAISKIEQDIEQSGNELEEISLEELAWYDGSSGKRKLLVGAFSEVFDVSAARGVFNSHYYKLLLGKDITRALITSRFQDLNKPLNELDIKDGEYALTFFKKTFPTVARLQPAESQGDSVDSHEKSSDSVCPENVHFSMEQVEDSHSTSDQLLAVAQDKESVLDVSQVYWLYGPHGVRFGRSPSETSIYPCVGRLAF